MEKTNKLFVYGILKLDKAADLSQHGGRFMGEATLDDAQLYGIGGGVGLRLNHDGAIANGQLFEVPQDKTWQWLDMIEANGYIYTREVVRVNLQGVGEAGEGIAEHDAWVYVHNYDFENNNGRKLEGNVYQGNY